MYFLTRKQTTRPIAQGCAVLSRAGPHRQIIAAAFAIALHGTVLATAPTAQESAQEMPDNMVAKEVGDISCQIPQLLYPSHAQQLGMEGTAILHITVGTRGQIETAEVRTSTGNAELDAAAVTSVMQAHCKLHQENGRPIRVSTLLPVSFYLERGHLKTI
ncbi:energy transducer TonB [Collimonas pratensis]|nr:energy transducer TonB [Collimonas pratensis]